MNVFKKKIILIGVVATDRFVIVSAIISTRRFTVLLLLALQRGWWYQP